MSWLAQVRHVMAKDLAGTWRFLLLYVAIVALATARAVGWSLLAAPLLDVLTIVVVLVGMLLVATVVQADSPTRSDAFWATHPLRPSAVAGAKVGYALLLVAIGLVGQLIALAAYRVPGPELIPLAARSIPAYGGWLLAVMVVAAVVRDLRSVVLTIVLFPVVSTVLAFVVMAGRSDGTITIDVPESWTPPLFVFHVVAVVAGLGMLAWLYRTRDARAPMRIAGFVAAVISLFGMSARDHTRLPGVSNEVPPIPLTLDSRVQRSHSNGIETLSLGVRARGADVPRGTRLVLLDPSVTAHLLDGTTIRLPVIGVGARIGDERRMTPDLPGVRWLGLPPADQLSASLTIVPTAGQRQELARGVARYVVEGRVAVFETRPTGSMPLTAGARLSTPGQRARIEEWTDHPGPLSLRLGASTVLGVGAHPALSPWASSAPGPVVAVVNEARGEAVAVEWTEGGNAYRGLALPGTSLRTGATRYSPDPWASSDNPDSPYAVKLDAAWLRDARVHLFTQGVRGSFPVRLTLDVP